MNLANVRKELAEQIQTITGLHTSAYPPDAVHPPAAVVSWDTYTYDETYRRGMDRLTASVVILVGKVSDRASWDLRDVYVNGSGPKSVKAVIEAGNYTAFHTVRVTDAESETLHVAGVEYLAAILTVDVVGGN